MDFAGLAAGFGTSSEVGEGETLVMSQRGEAEVLGAEALLQRHTSYTPLEVNGVCECHLTFYNSTLALQGLITTALCSLKGRYKLNMIW